MEDREYLERFQFGLREIRWVRPELFHLTLRFLGKADEPILDSLVPEIQKIASNLSIHCELASPIHMIQKNGKSVIAIPTTPSESLFLLYTNLTSIVEREGFARERRNFLPHITLGRLNRWNDKHIIDYLSLYSNLENRKIKFPSLSIMRSDLKPDGPVYSPLFRLELT